MSNVLAVSVAEYINKHRPNQRRELQRMAECEDVAGALKLAVTYEYTDKGPLHSHQCRIGYERLSQCEMALRDVLDDLRSSTTFDQIYACVSHVIGGMSRIGPLTVYDISLRLGAFLNLYPMTVYLHTGALEGARKYGFVAKNGQLHKSALPNELQQLEPHEIENFLCIYKRGTASSCQPVARSC